MPYSDPAPHRCGAAARAGRRLQRRHVLMLALAIEVLCLGMVNADRYRPPGIIVEQTIARDNVIT